MNIHWIQHVPFEGLGSIESWAGRCGHRIHSTRLYRQDPLPAMDQVDWLIVMGGPMNIYEEDKFPWLAEEKRFIKEFIQSGRTVLGICLGAQLIADALGSKVYAGPHKEIGWFPILKTKEASKSKIFRDFPSETNAFHWHGDTFDLPPGCVRIAESAACRNQAFAYKDQVIGLQFHLEITRQGAEALVSNCGNELVEASFIQKPDSILAGDCDFVSINERMELLLNRLASAYNGSAISSCRSAD